MCVSSRFYFTVKVFKVAFRTSEICILVIGAVVELDEDGAGGVGAARIEHVGMSVDVDSEDGKIERGAADTDEK